MKPKPVVLRERARRDVDDAIVFYLQEGGQHVALAFIDALERAFGRMARHPVSGSPRYAHELNLPGLRCASAWRGSHLIFYIERTADIDVWRVLRAERDVPSSLREPESA